MPAQDQLPYFLLSDKASDIGHGRSNPVLIHNPDEIHGFASRSMSRWLLGVPTLAFQGLKYMGGINLDPYLPFEDERSDEVGVLTFTTEPFQKDFEVCGPLSLQFWANTSFGPTQSFHEARNTLDKLLRKASAMPGVPTLNLEENSKNYMQALLTKRDVQWIVELNDVFPSGRAKNVSSGWLAASHRQYDPKEPKGIREHSIDPDYTPFDPFYDKPDRFPKPINEGDLYQYCVEIWPTCNVFKKGHRLRISISASDFPHVIPTLVLSRNTIVMDSEHKASLRFYEANRSNEGQDWKWVNDIDSYLRKN